jgi:predicted nucleic acid-binding protein
VSVADTGFVVALVNPLERNHRRCTATMHELPSRMITTLAVLTESMHLIGSSMGWRGQDRLWQFFERAVDLRELTPAMGLRARELMSTYRDSPMDLADATLVALAEAERDWLILTLDGHFRTYRPLGRPSFDILPEP